LNKILIGTLEKLDKGISEKGLLRLNRIAPLIVILTILMLIVVSCATKPPVLYKNGKPLSIVEYQKIAQNEYEEGNYDNAILAYKAIIDNYTENTKAVIWANYEIGYCYYMKKDYDKAEAYFRKVINEFNEPAAKKLSTEMLDKISEQKKKKKK